MERDAQEFNAVEKQKVRAQSKCSENMFVPVAPA